MSSRAAGGAGEVWIGRSVVAPSSLSAGVQPERRVARMTNHARIRSGAPIMIEPVYRDAAGMRRTKNGSREPEGHQWPECLCFGLPIVCKDRNAARVHLGHCLDTSERTTEGETAQHSRDKAAYECRQMSNPIRVVSAQPQKRAQLRGTRFSRRSHSVPRPSPTASALPPHRVRSGAATPWTAAAEGERR